MKRTQFLKIMATLPLTGAAMKLSSLSKITEPMGSTERMPVLFLGHGSPMNAIEEKDENAAFFNDKAVAGALTMTSVKMDKS